MDSDEDHMSDDQQDQVDEIRNKLILFILNNVQSKLPIKNSDLTELAGKNMRLFKESFESARLVLEDTYGILVKEVADGKTGKKFICYSELPACSSWEYDEEQFKQSTLLYLIVSYIFMCDAYVEEEQLIQFLQSMNIHFNQTHPYFGESIKKVVTETFVRQLYLKREKSDTDAHKETTYVYSLGFRSALEFNKKELLETTAKILKRPSKLFVSQYKKANEQAEEEEEEA